MDDGCNLSVSDAVGVCDNAQSARNANVPGWNTTARHAAVSAASAAATSDVPRWLVGPGRLRLPGASASASAAIHAATSRSSWRKRLSPNAAGFAAGRNAFWSYRPVLASSIAAQRCSVASGTSGNPL